MEVSTNKYRDYFDIDPEYFPQVNEQVIKNNPDLWKKFYPHETFVKLIKDTISVLSRKQKLSVWVEGAYGTGKSHAVLTLKKLLDANEEETREYFNKYPDQLSNDLYNQFQQLKSEKKIITVHRYGSSNIEGDNKLVIALQESIVLSLKENGVPVSNASLKESIISWLSGKSERNYFNDLINGEYRSYFGGDNVDAIIEKLKTYDGDELMMLISNISKVGEGKNFSPLHMDVNGFIKWVKQIIEENDLKAIVFIWDEFTEYFRRNLKALTGFQQIAELSATEPFYLFIVTHKSTGLFSDTDKDQKRILDRFVKPTCQISLPENMAFRLMGAAMSKNEDTAIRKEWQKYSDDLYMRTKDSRDLVKNKAKISDKELKDVLPIHPYAALLLKYISSAFDSNQRSMFDFIKNDRGDEIKGFQWFIDNYGPLSHNPLLTIDMLWDFFYEKNKESLPTDIRSILNHYNSVPTDSMRDDEKRVLKTVLLLQSVSQRVGDSVALFIPNEKNLNNAFEGSGMEHRRATQIAEKLCRDKILYHKPLGNGKEQYAAMVNAGDINEIDKLKDQYTGINTSVLIQQGELQDVVPLKGALSLRYDIKFVSSAELDKKAKNMRSLEESSTGYIAAIVAIAKDDEESATIAKTINKFVNEKTYRKVIFIDASSTPLGRAAFNEYVEAMANAEYYRRKDNNLADTYQQNANDVLKKWGKNIASGNFKILYDDEAGNVVDKTVISADKVCDILAEIDREYFNLGLETGSSVIDNMWAAKNLKQGAECGITGKLAGTFKSGSKQTDLGEYIGADVWGKSVEFKYWEESPNLTISKIKQRVLDIINAGFAKDGRVAISEIYDALCEAPFGFLACNLAAFVMGFVLREYVDGSYSYSDDLAMSGVLTTDKLKEMIEEVIKRQLTPSMRYRNKYIVKLTENERAFNEASSKIFEIPLDQCVNIERTRDRIRNQMKKHAFPFWCLKYVLEEGTVSSMKNDKGLVSKLIDLYLGIANDGNKQDEINAHDMAIEVGKLCIEHPDLAADLASISTVQERYIDGIKTYSKEFDNGALVKLSEEIDDNGQYVNVLKAKFNNTDAAKWLWSQETANDVFKDVILEYSIIVESNKVINKTKSFDDCKSEWLDRCRYIRMSYEAAERDLEDGKEFLKVLYDMKISRTIPNKKKFYDLLVADMQGFKNFYDHQVDVFKKVGAYYINSYSFTDEDLNEIYTKFPSDCWTMRKSQYMNLVKDKCEEFNANSSTAKLRKLWREKTGTGSPREWSATRKMPILCIIDDEQYLAARKAFEVINQKNPDIDSVNDAISFLESATFYDKLNSEKACDDAFREKIIKDYGVLLTDVNEVKDYLFRSIGSNVYDWVDLHDKVDEKLHVMADAKYAEAGYDRAIEKIDSMDAEAVKRYLKELVRQDVIVGMKIIEGK